ncbi:hypothetical protein LCL97_15830 [Seohaeicola saemankumensis]|nr:hypothetical protein [Seohaeicola saemankumensis]MCA0872305.1 hypothetical protein [Seohaeicola saemankumensis]
MTLNFDTWNDARLVGRAADLWVRQDSPAAGELHLGDSYEMRRAFARGYAWIKIHYPDKTASLRRTIADYDSLLTATGIDDHHVTAPHDGGARPGQIARSLIVLLLASPLLILSIALNWLPVQISRVFARGKDPDKMATWAIFSSLILFPVAWLIEAGLAGGLCAKAFGAPWGWASVFAVLVAAPLSGRAALTFHDTRRRLFSQARAWWLLRTRRDLGPLLAATRRNALRDLREIVDIYDTESG